jgi:hypothetical protein
MRVAYTETLTVVQRKLQTLKTPAACHWPLREACVSGGSTRSISTVRLTRYNVCLKLF